MESLANAGVPETDTLSNDLASFNIQRIGGQPPFAVSLPLVSALSDLHHAIANAASCGPFGFKLVTEDCTVLMGNLDTKLVELGLADGATLTMIRDCARDYSRITGPDKVIYTGECPKGILIDEDGKLYVTHRDGDLMVYDSKLEEVRDTVRRLFAVVKGIVDPFGFGAMLSDWGEVGRASISPRPEQMTLSPSGELVVAFGDGVRVFDRGTLKELRHFHIGPTTGVAVEGDLLYTSIACRKIIRVHQFKDGKPVGHISPGLNNPRGLAIVDGRKLAVADCDNNRILLLEIDTLDVESQLPPEGAPQGQLLSRPNDAIADAAGNLLVMDTGHQRIAVFREDGVFVASASLQGLFTDHGNIFDCMGYISYNQITGAIAVSDSCNNCVKLFSPIFKTESVGSAEGEAEVN